MERLRQLIVYIQSQLRALSTAERIAIGLCGVVVVGSLLWLVRWSTVPEMSPVLSHDFSFEQLSAAEDALRAGGIDYRIVGSQLYVKPSERHNALRLLHNGNALPEGSLYDMYKLVTQDNPFQAPESRAYAQNYATGNELAKILVTYPFVQKASVLINPVSKRRMGRASDEPTASVTVTLSPSTEMLPDMVEAIARLVSGAVTGLKPHNVAVVDGRSIRSYSVPRPEDAGRVNHWRIVEQLEQRYLEKIRSKLADIPGLLATVTLELDSSRRVKQTNVHDAPQPRVESQSSEEQMSSDGPTEPGVQANVGQAVTSSAGQRSSNEESNTENFEPKLRETETVEEGPSIKRVTAAIGIPRSFVVGVYQAKFPDKDAPADDDPEFAGVRDAQVVRVKASVERIVMARTSDDVQVDIYPDVEWTSDGQTVWQSSPEVVRAADGGVGTLGLLNGLTNHLPQAGLLLLAMVSLVMVARIARRSAQLAHVGKPSMPIHPPGSEPILTAGPQAVGKAAASESFLVGKEVDEESLRYAELSDEVSRMVQDDPEGAARMIKGWVEGAE